MKNIKALIESTSTPAEVFRSLNEYSGNFVPKKVDLSSEFKSWMKKNLPKTAKSIEYGNNSAEQMAGEKVSVHLLYWKLNLNTEGAKRYMLHHQQVAGDYDITMLTVSEILENGQKRAIGSSYVDTKDLLAEGPKKFKDITRQ